MSATVRQELLALARREVARGATGPWILAFSGGPDSTALAAALAEVEANFGVDLHLVHVDHALDEGSAGRASRARAIADHLALPFHLLRRPVPPERRKGENLEAAARRVRYGALEEVRGELGADRILTAHHRDDQAETVLLRMRSGTGLFGLSGIRERAGPIWRPALHLPRAALHELLDARRLAPVDDPSNLDLARDRNRLRHLLLPELRTLEPGIDVALAELAQRALSARMAIQRRLESAYDMAVDARGASLATAALRRHPPLLNLFALQLVETAAGATLRSSGRSKLELLRQLEDSPATHLEISSGRRWHVEAGGRLRLAREAPSTARIPPFSYTLTVPGEVAVPELGGIVRLSQRSFESWMLRGERSRAALRFPASVPARLEIRNRRPGDRLRPLGAPGMRGLKELLIDRKVPRSERDRIPLLVADGRVAWVPGITVAEEFRLQGEDDCWVAEWLPDPESPLSRSTFWPGPSDRRTRPEEEIP